MRYIAKSAEPPRSIQEWLTIQAPVGVNLNYNGFTRKAQLRTELIESQFGLCAYTGAPLDARLARFADGNFSFAPHIEHVKPRSVCKEARGGVYGRDLCEDMDHRNLVAALEVKRRPPSQVERFGAAAHDDEVLPVTPLQATCEARFAFDADGRISGTDHDADSTIQLLKLDHVTLEGWRRAAISAFFPPDEALSRDEIEERIAAMVTPIDGSLPEFSFCIKSYGESLL